jgi:hypothetical protein
MSRIACFCNDFQSGESDSKGLLINRLRLARPGPSHTKAQLRHTQSEFGTPLANRQRRLHRYDFALLAAIVNFRACSSFAVLQ